MLGRICDTGRRLYPASVNKVETIVADPADPDVLYVRETYPARPRTGPLLHLTTWTRFALAPGREQEREIEVTGVLSVA